MRKGLRTFTLAVLLGFSVSLTSCRGCSKEKTTTTQASETTQEKSSEACIISSDIEFNDLKGNMTVANSVSEYDFSTITVSNQAKFIVSKDSSGTNIVNDKKGTLDLGDNVFYIIVTAENNVTTKIYTATIRRRPLYTVSFNTDGGDDISSIQVEEDSQIEGQYKAVKEGYSFIGWYLDDTKIDSEYVVTKDIELMAKYDADTMMYTVKHHFKNLENDQYTLDSSKTEVLSGKTNEQTVAKALETEGFTAATFEQQSIKSDGTTIIDIYYDRLSYTITTSSNNTEAGTITAYNVESIPFHELLTLTVVVNDGYIFDGWYNGDTYLSNELTYSFYMPSSDIEYSAHFSLDENTKYLVYHYFENLDDTNYSIDEDKTNQLSGATGSKTKAEALDIIGFEAKTIEQETILGDGSTKVKIYYDRIRYTLTTTSNNSKAGTVTLYDSATFTYDTTIKLTTEVNDGYTFNGWYNKEDFLSKESEYTFKISESLELLAKFTPNEDTKYTVTYYEQNISDSNYTALKPVELSGTTATLTEAEPEEKTGFTMQEFEQKEIKGDGSTNIDIYYDRNSYTLTTKINISEAGTITSYDEKSFKFDAAIALEMEELNDGYAFIGWYDGGTKLSSKQSYQYNMGAKDIVIEAKFEALKYTVTMNAEGCIYSGEETYVVAYNESFEFPEAEFIDTSSKAYKKSYNFVGWKYNGTVITDSKGKLLNNWNILENITLVPEFELDSIYYGSYPQAKVEATEENGLASIGFDSSTWTNYGYYTNGSISSYMYYYDLDANDDEVYDYRGVYFTTNRQDASTNGYSTNTCYWFGYEPIQWKVLETKNNKAFLFANLILDSQNYHYGVSKRTGAEDYQGNSTTSDVYANNYMYSYIREWLNESFYETAFNDLEKNILVTTSVDNSALSAYHNSMTEVSKTNPRACSNTNDKIFILSVAEIMNYFNAYAPEIKSTDYAACQGGCICNNDDSYIGNGYYWLRSPYYKKDDYAFYVNSYGQVPVLETVKNVLGVVPACWITL